MSIFHKTFDEVKEDDLKLLIESGTTEGLQLELKETITNNISLVEEVAALQFCVKTKLIILHLKKRGI